MIKVRLQIGDGPIEDTFAKWGFIFMDADKRTEAPIKGRPTSSYAEEAGEHTDPRTVPDAFDYKVTFLIEAPNRNLTNVNAKIAAFNKALYTRTAGSDIRTYKEVTFYNDYNRVKIVGLPEPIAEPTEFYRRHDGRVMDCAEVELKIRVSNPSLCNFSLKDGNCQDDISLPMTLETDGVSLYVKTSRTLTSDEFPCLLRRGAARTNRGSITLKNPRRRNRWQVVYKNANGLIPFKLNSQGKLVEAFTPDILNGESILNSIYWELTATKSRPVVKIKKAQSSRTVIPAIGGLTSRVCYGIAIYRRTKQNTDGEAVDMERISNVCYFRSNVKMLRTPTSMSDTSAMRQWLSV